MLRRVKHDHVVALFATYQYHQSYHLILPWAECNLREYWSDPSRWSQDHDLTTLRWMTQQCQGIAEGLNQVHHHLTTSMTSLRGQRTEATTAMRGRQMSTRAPGDTVTPRSHRFFGLHGDIKPSNILWFPSDNDMGTLKIADFGAGEFNPIEFSKRPSTSVSFTPPYLPPEHGMPPDTDGFEESVQLSPAYDIWALGCLYLEFITWYAGGQKLLGDFEDCRRARARFAGATFFECTDKEPHVEIKPAVLEVRRG